MKRLAIFATLITGLILNGCDPAATFDSPQPEKGKGLGSLPRRIHGTYIDKDQASTITINDMLITRHYNFDYKESITSLDSTFQIVGDTLIHLKDKLKEQVRIEEDTIIRHYEGTDTLFNISEDHVLKKLKGYYFLNKRSSTNSWEVMKLGLQKGMLSIGTISYEDDVQKLKEITETTTDTISTQFTLTRKQFVAFIKQEGFSDQDTFIRIKISNR